MRIIVFYIVVALTIPTKHTYGQNKKYGQFSLPKLIPIESNGKFGYCNQNKKIVIAPKFDFAYPFNEDCDVSNDEHEEDRKFGTKYFATVTIKSKKFRIDSLGKIVFAYPEDFNNCELGEYEQPYTKYSENQLFGIKMADSILIKAKFDNIYPITHLRPSSPFIFKLNNHYGLVDETKTLIKEKYDTMEYPFHYASLSCPLLLVRKNTKKFYVDFLGIEYYTTKK